MRVVTVIVLVALIVLAGCESLTGPRGSAPEIQLPRALSGDERALITAGNQFAVDLIRQVDLDDPEHPNTFLSPLSASMALGMVMNGTAGDTWTQMRDGLGFAGLDEPAINQAYRDLIDLLRGLDPKVQFGLGNSVWARHGVPFHQDFLDRTRTFFDAQVESLDFEDPASVAVMNEWVEDITNGRIRELIDEIDPDAIAYLINAVYFNGDWTYRFEEAETRPRPFTRADGEAVEVEMMAMETDLRFFNDGIASVVELPYGGGAFSAILALPAPGSTMSDLVAHLDGPRWALWMTGIEQAEPRAAGVMLPRLELDYERTLNQDLQALGIRDAFNADGPVANFSRLTPWDAPGKVYLSRVQQKSFLKVDERGTEAAAATFAEVVIICAGCGAPNFVFDRPFLFAIRERLSGTILFIGVIGDPTA